MREELIKLSEMRQNEGGLIVQMNTPKDITIKLTEMGLSTGEVVSYIRSAPLGDPIEVEVMNSRLAIRKREASDIIVKRIQPQTIN